ncbi:DNA-3-methyladenine glycosylase 2 family protein [Deinococcus wulumuqiensis]|uniref:DNA-3-methyladenine glycosylase II n=1 Tax=Deinococcus wulumuqiensis TaxID=980427 RepID=A0A345IIJ5_9DEIO|nr:3-methyladenine DNA glycosylase AlkA [Deinococcus wulumuqiensis]AXG99517.1 DNA-3-methyladenine glycosylase 2 family protein [Deinococcus wulumuqiensis]
MTAAPPALPPLTDHAGATAHLSRDPVMAQVIALCGELTVLTPTPDPFGRLVRSVAGQQVSVKAAQAVYGRLETLLGTITPAALLGVTGDDLRGAGLSWAKVRTVQAAAVAAETGQIDFAHLAQQTDATVVAELVVLPGIGQWTAEMFLLFALARPDVFSYGDLALRQGVARLYPGEDWQAVTGHWAPYRSLASRYLWADNARLRAGGAPL